MTYVYLRWKRDLPYCPLIRSDLKDNAHLIAPGAAVITQQEFYRIAADYPDFLDFLDHIDRRRGIPVHKPVIQPLQPTLL